MQVVLYNVFKMVVVVAVLPCNKLAFAEESGGPRAWMCRWKDEVVLARNWWLSCGTGDHSGRWHKQVCMLAPVSVIQ